MLGIGRIDILQQGQLAFIKRLDIREQGIETVDADCFQVRTEHALYRPFPAFFHIQNFRQTLGFIQVLALQPVLDTLLLFTQRCLLQCIQ